MTGSLVGSLLSRGGSGGGSWPMSKVIVKANSLPTAEIKYVGSMYIYAGETTAAYKHGYIYEGTSTPANTKTVSFSPNTISCTGENFWAFWKSEEGAPSNYTEIVKGEMVFVGGNTWNLIGRNTNNEIVKSYQQYDEDWEALGFTFTGTFSEGDVVYFNCAINETDGIIYWWQRIDVQPAWTSSSTGIAVDDQLSLSSQNPVQNKVITEALEETGYDTWKKPEGWPDIRSGALDNSVYFLVGHSIPTISGDTWTIANYPKFALQALVSNSGTYDVYIDGVKQYTTASGSATTIDWTTLKLESGFDTTYPSVLHTHIVRITSSVSTNTITQSRCHINGGAEQGVLWVHFNISNAIDLSNFLAESGNSNQYANRLCEAITTNGDEIAVTSSIVGFVRNCSTLKYLPTINLSNESINAYRAFTNANALKKVSLKNGTLGGSSQFFYNSAISHIYTDNAFVELGNYTFSNATALKEIPQLKLGTRGIDGFVRCDNLTPTFLDLSQATEQREIRFSGASEHITNLVALTVSSSAPFDGSSPQINVSYAGLDRAALVNLFNSMPYNVGYEVVGAPSIVDGVASGFSSSNYLYINNISSANSIEININATINNLSTWQSIFRCSVSRERTLEINGSNGTLRYYYLTTNGTSSNIGDISGVVANVPVNCNLRASGTTLKVIITQNNTELFNTTVNDSNFSDLLNQIWFGYVGKDVFLGSIDFNRTYIKVNGIPWFRGTAAMTKTCDVRGCTGTADLTQTDKDIALDKGWSLTVA